MIHIGPDGTGSTYLQHLLHHTKLFEKNKRKFLNPAAHYPLIMENFGQELIDYGMNMGEEKTFQYFFTMKSLIKKSN